MASTESVRELDEGSVNELRTGEDSLNTSVKHRQNKEDNTSFSDIELNEKPPILSAQLFRESEKSKDYSHQVEEISENTKPADGQPFEVFSETDCIKFAEKLHKVKFDFYA